MSSAAVVAVIFEFTTGAQVLLGLIVVAATLESVLAICVGCIIFSGLMRVGLVPAETCEACANVTLRAPARA